MSVLTEAKIRKLFKELVIVENGVFELEAGEKLTPAARGFLSDHHVKVISVNQPQKVASVAKYNINDNLTTHDDIYKHLFKLTKLYPYLLRMQRELYQAFQSEKSEQVGVLLNIVENIVGQNIQEDISMYHTNILTNAELQAIRVTKQLDQQSVMMSYTVNMWQLSGYETYIETVLLRKELELLNVSQSDAKNQQVFELLKSLEVLLWLIASE